MKEWNVTLCFWPEFPIFPLILPFLSFTSVISKLFTFSFPFRWLQWNLKSVVLSWIEFVKLLSICELIFRRKWKWRKRRRKYWNIELIYLETNKRKKTTIKNENKKTWKCTFWDKNCARTKLKRKIKSNHSV